MPVHHAPHFLFFSLLLITALVCVCVCVEGSLQIRRGGGEWWRGELLSMSARTFDLALCLGVEAGQAEQRIHTLMCVIILLLLLILPAPAGWLVVVISPPCVCAPSHVWLHLCLSNTFYMCMCARPNSILFKESPPSLFLFCLLLPLFCF